jgi:hypothetical protein
MSDHIKSSLILWQGLSLIDGAPIAVIATGIGGNSGNAKTGGMRQTFIIRADMHPVAALESGADESVCGNCPSRPYLASGAGAKRGPCYVEVGKSVASVYRAYARGRYATAADEAAIEAAGAGADDRGGTYGDPAAAPAWIWRAFYRRAKSRTGYTHAWRHPDPLVRANAEALRPYMMASCDTPLQAMMARAAGWRYFRVRASDGPLLEGESVCPASAEAGKVTDCQTCHACDGAVPVARRASSPSRVIIAHGPLAPRWRAMQARLLADEAASA